MDLEIYKNFDLINSWQENLIRRYANDNFIKPPEPSDGISVCSVCGAKYAGKQDRCTNKIPFVQTIGYYGDIRETPFMRSNREHHLSKKFYYRVCGSDRLRWDLEYGVDRFNDYMRFLSDLENLDYQGINSHYLETLQPEVLVSLTQKLLIKVVAIDKDVKDMKDAIMELARKIDNAGNALRF
jgi:hypothetical protein